MKIRCSDEANEDKIKQYDALIAGNPRKITFVKGDNKI